MTAIRLPFPDKILWPNGRSRTWHKKHAAAKLHKLWAWAATVQAGVKAPKDRIDWSVTIHPKTAHAIDDDNARASLKAYQDGIALALGVDDKQFNAPTLRFAEPLKGGAVVIEIGGAS